MKTPAWLQEVAEQGNAIRASRDSQWKARIAQLKVESPASGREDGWNAALDALSSAGPARDHD